MEQTVMHMAAAAAWVFVIIFAFAIVGVIATIRWIIGLFMRGERAVESGVSNIERRL
jgi:hypothetical protein